MTSEKWCAHCGYDIDCGASDCVWWCIGCINENIDLLNALKLEVAGTGKHLTFSVRNDYTSSYSLSFGVLPNVAKLRAIPRKEEMPKENFKIGDRVLYASIPATIVAPTIYGYIVRYDVPNGSCVSMTDCSDVVSRVLPICRLLGFDPEEKAYHFASVSLLKHQIQEPEIVASNETCQAHNKSTALTVVGLALGVFGAAYEANKRLEAKAMHARVVKDEQTEEEQNHERATGRSSSEP